MGFWDVRPGVSGRQIWAEMIRLLYESLHCFLLCLSKKLHFSHLASQDGVVRFLILSTYAGRFSC